MRASFVMGNMLMIKLAVSSLLAFAAFSVISVAKAQPPLIGAAQVPETLPNSMPYGPPLTLAQARKIIDAAEAEAGRRHWQYAVAVVDSGGNLLPCDRMDDTQLASLAIAEAKARASALGAAPARRSPVAFCSTFARQGVRK